MRISYPTTSPYARTAQTSWYLGRYVDRVISPDSTDVPITLTSRYHLRPDMLSNDLYGTPAYWWIFMQRNINTIRDPIWDFVAGIDIWTPTKSRLTALLGT